jgi:Skp family chaperone for outer membrane proteins
MNKSRVLFVTLLAGVLAVLSVMAINESSAQQAAARAGVSRVAVCDVVRVFRNYDRAKELASQLNKRKTTIDAENEERGRAIEDIQAKLSRLNRGSEAYEEQFAKAQQLTIERQAWYQFQTAVAMREHHRLTRQMYGQILDAVAKVAEQQNIGMVLFQPAELPETEDTQQLMQLMQSRTILYADESADVTEDVLLMLNSAHTQN